MTASRRLIHRVMKLKSFKVFLDCDREFSVLKWAPKSQDLSPVEHFLGTDLHHGSADDVMPSCRYQTNSEERFQQLVETVPQRINTKPSGY